MPTTTARCPSKRPRPGIGSQTTPRSVSLSTPRGSSLRGVVFFHPTQPGPQIFFLRNVWCGQPEPGGEQRPRRQVPRPRSLNASKQRTTQRAAVRHRAAVCYFILSRNKTHILCVASALHRIAHDIGAVIRLAALYSRSRKKSGKSLLFSVDTFQRQRYHPASLHQMDGF